MKNSQKGFTAIEGLLIAIIVLMIGFIGYYVYHAQQQTSKTLNNTQADSASTTSSKKSTTNTQTANDLKTDTLADGVSFSYSSKEWLLVPQSDHTHCGQSVLSSAQCDDYAELVLQKDGNVNSDQFQVDIGVFGANNYKDAKDWFLQYLDASEGGEPNGNPSASQSSTIGANSSYFEQSDYGTNESRLSWGVLGNSSGALVKSVLFNGDHYSFQTTNDYFTYKNDVEAIVNSIKIK